MAFRTSGRTFWASGGTFFAASTPRPAPTTTPRIPESPRISLGYPRRGRGNDASYRLTGRIAVTVKIHTEDGRIQEERTYPKAADPVRSPG